MRIPKQVSLTKSLALTISLVLLVSGIVYVLAAAPSSTFWLAPGVYPGAPSFTVWREGSNYFAKNANGEIEFSGTNFTDVIQDSIDAASGLGGSMVLLLNGEYNPTQAILMKSHVHLKGESREGTLIKVASGTSDNWGGVHVVIAYYDSGGAKGYNFSITDLTVDTNPLGISYVVRPVHLMTVHETARIENVKVLGFNGTNTAGISVNYGEYDWIVDNIVVEGGKGGSTTCEAFYIHATNSSQIVGNIINNMSREGIYVANSEHNIFSHNVIYNVDAEGIDVKETSSYNIFSDNQLRNCTNGIYVQSNYNVISNNRFYYGTNGIVVSSGGGPGLPKGNTISGNNVFEVSSIGIAIEAGAQSNSVSGNTVTDSVYGIRVMDGANITITGGEYAGNTHGVEIRNSTFILVIGVMTIGNTDHGIWETSIGSPDYNVIVSCISRDSGTADILTRGANTQVHLCYNGTTWIS